MKKVEYILSLSYGKDSLACIGAIKELGLPLDRIVHCEVWATPTIQADLPPMVEFKEKADKIIKDKFGYTVERVKAPYSYQDYFYKICNGKKSKYSGEIYGFPFRRGAWCNSRLKVSVLNKIKGCHYVGIAYDEPNRFHVLDNNKKISPLVLAKWTEKDCYNWCVDNDLLSPIYTTLFRGGCWFCHNQGVNQLRLLRNNYPELWELLLKWDKDSISTFKANGHTVADYEERFKMEDEKIIDIDDKWHWSNLDFVQLKMI